MSLLVVGTVAFDAVETPFGKRDQVLGGSASFFSHAAANFTKVQIVSVVGEDFPADTLATFAPRGIDTSGVQRLPGATFRWKGRYDHNLNVAHTLETQLNVLMQFDPKLPDSYKRAEYVFLGNFDPELQGRVVDQLERPKLIACDTMNFWISGANAQLKKTLARVDLLSINDGEARQLSGEYNLVKAAAVIRRMGPKILVVKRGEYGALLFTDAGIFAAPAYPLEVILDPTGAGDSFAGGMMGYLARSERLDEPGLRQAVITGSVMASFAVEDFSLDRLKRLTQDEIGLRFDQFKALTHFEAAGASLLG